MKLKKTYVSKTTVRLEPVCGCDYCDQYGVDVFHSVPFTAAMLSEAVGPECADRIVSVEASDGTDTCVLIEEEVPPPKFAVPAHRMFIASRPTPDFCDVLRPIVEAARFGTKIETVKLVREKLCLNGGAGLSLIEAKELTEIILAGLRND